MTIQQAIQKAIDGGWKSGNQHFYEFESGARENLSSIFLQPLFWQSLGKSLGWKDCEKGFSGKGDDEHSWQCREWEHRWHDFIHHLVEGKSIKSYFEQL